MFVYKNIVTGKFVIVQSKMDNPNMTLLREVKEVRIYSEEINCNMFFISEDNKENDIFVIT